MNNLNFKAGILDLHQQAGSLDLHQTETSLSHTPLHKGGGAKLLQTCSSKLNTRPAEIGSVSIYKNENIPKQGRNDTAKLPSLRAFCKNAWQKKSRIKQKIKCSQVNGNIDDYPRYLHFFSVLKKYVILILISFIFAGCDKDECEPYNEYITPTAKELVGTVWRDDPYYSDFKNNNYNEIKFLTESDGYIYDADMEFSVIRDGKLISKSQGVYEYFEGSGSSIIRMRYSSDGWEYYIRGIINKNEMYLLIDYAAPGGSGYDGTDYEVFVLRK